MSLRTAGKLLGDAKREAKGNPALTKTVQAAQEILEHLLDKERKESAVRVSPRAVRRTGVINPPGSGRNTPKF